jgi:GNAT superfamily N-acetyltransferase
MNITYRKLLAVEKGLYTDHLMRLESQDRMMRFETAATDTFIQNYTKGINMRRDAIFAAFDDDLVMRGAAHVAYSNALADLGLSVEQEFRGKGVGTTLLEKAINWSRVRYAKTFSSQCLVHNRWMMRKVKELGFDVSTDIDTAVATAPLDPPDLALIRKVIFEEQVGLLNYNTKLFFGLLMPK